MLREPKYNFNVEYKSEVFDRISMKEVAQRMDMSNVYLSYLVNNKYPFNFWTAKTLLEVVGFSKGEIKENFNKYFKQI